MKSLLTVERNCEMAVGIKTLPSNGVGKNERGVSLKYRCIVLSLILAISLLSGFSMAQNADESTNGTEIDTTVVAGPTETSTTDLDAAEPEAFTQPETSATEGAESAALTLQGTWILTADDSLISMVIHQSEDILFGAANSQTPKPWNGVVSGSVSGDDIELHILSLQDGVLVSTLIVGTATADDLAGSFVQSDSNGKVNEGMISGFLANPDTSGYEPARVAAAAPVTTAATLTPAAETPAVAMTAPTTDDGRKKPVDVTTLMSFPVGAGAPLPI